MKLHRKLAKLARRETYRRGWRRAQRSVFRLPLGPVLAGLDQSRLAQIQKLYAGEKYADVDQWLRVNRERVQDLKLHRSRPLRAPFQGIARSLWRAAHRLPDSAVRIAPESSSTIRLDHGVFDWI